MFNDENEDDSPRLSAETLKVLQEFLQEQKFNEGNCDAVSENWQLSQFWYDDNTTASLSDAATLLCKDGEDSANIALISCPTLYPSIKSIVEGNEKSLLILFEYDKRFSKYGEDYVFYDYNEPLNINSFYEKKFDVIVVDPPFLSEECLTKTAQTVNFIKKPNCKIILCTGSVMEGLAEKLLNIKKCSFQPCHKNNLANEFICLTNFGELPIKSS